MSRLTFTQNQIGSTVSGEVVKVNSVQKAINTVKLINQLTAKGYIILVNYRMGIPFVLEVGCFRNLLNSVGARFFYIPVMFLEKIISKTEVTIMKDKLNDMIKENTKFFNYIEDYILPYVKDTRDE